MLVPVACHCVVVMFVPCRFAPWPLRTGSLARSRTGPPFFGVLDPMGARGFFGLLGEICVLGCLSQKANRTTEPNMASCAHGAQGTERKGSSEAGPIGPLERVQRKMGKELKYVYSQTEV